MSDLETLQAEIKKLSTQALNAKMDLHDLSEELPVNWETIPSVAQTAYDRYKRLTELKAQLKALGG
ncbi:MAG: hypothetical protein RL173_546 [Fibrobacterota bacterium]|jgi:hypothetical protein